MLDQTSENRAERFRSSLVTRSNLPYLKLDKGKHSYGHWIGHRRHLVLVGYAIGWLGSRLARQYRTIK